MRLLFIFFVLVVAPLSMQSQAASNKALGQAKTILVYGDSLSAAYNIPLASSWPSLLEKRLSEIKPKHQVINLSISGETSAGGLSRWKAARLKYKPDILILELGANDGLRGLSLKSMSNNLSTIIEDAQKRNIKVVLAGIYLPPNYGPAFQKIFYNTYTKLQTQYQIGFIPFLLEGVALKPEFMQSDGLHPNAEAQPIILNNVWPHLQILL